MSEINSPINKYDLPKISFANLTDSNCLMISELEQKLQEETGEKVVLVAYRI